MTDPQDRRQALPQLSPVDQKDAGFLLGGVEVDERAVRDLVRILDRPLARKLDVALLSSAKMVRLSSHERRDVLAGLAYAQGDLQSLRESLLTDPAWRRWELIEEEERDLAVDGDSSGPTTSARGDAVALRLHEADVERNRRAWNAWAPDFYRVGLDYWLAEEPVWGIWGTPESRLGLLAGVEQGTGAIELGCGTAHVCAWLAQRGALPVGVDISHEQLDSARMFQRQFQRLFPLVRASADDVPLDDESFDFAISEYGASTWLDPYWWVPEAARLLRPGGKLVFLVSGAIMMSCTPADGAEATRVLERDYFGMHRFEFPGESFVEFHLSHGDWLRVLRANGFELEDLIEVQPSEGASTRFPFVSNEWARRWPSEEIWIARRRG